MSIENPLKRFSSDADADRFEHHIKPHVRNKRVIDVGCVQHSLKQVDREGWLHGSIVDVAKQTVGLDIVGDAIDELRTRGYTVEKRDVQDPAPDAYNNFDVVVMGELIEHLTDFETALSNARAWLKPDGKLILTTPNALSAYWLLLRGLNSDFVNTEHTCWFDSTTLEQLLSRCQYELIQLEYVRMGRFQALARPTTAVGYFIERLFPPRIAHRNMVAVARPV